MEETAGWEDRPVFLWRLGFGRLVSPEALLYSQNQNFGSGSKSRITSSTREFIRREGADISADAPLYKVVDDSYSSDERSGAMPDSHTFPTLLQFPSCLR